MRLHKCVSLIVVWSLGCGGSSVRLAPVTGTITMDGKPLVGADVSFTPSAPTKGVQAPTSSIAKTDDQGSYSLETLDGRKGAVVGRHKVTISSLMPDTGDERPTRGGTMKDKIPARYNSESTLEFDVPADGSTKADFTLTSDAGTKGTKSKGK